MNENVIIGGDWNAGRECVLDVCHGTETHTEERQRQRQRLRLRLRLETEIETEETQTSQNRHTRVPRFLSPHSSFVIDTQDELQQPPSFIAAYSVGQHWDLFNDTDKEPTAVYVSNSGDMWLDR